ncbi:Uncharacterised protein [Campylobacter hyointestinalis subsp. hyointestinalis]|uniref:Lipoprotein n=1 Tax=Campylobacter hyointestinalis subsp. hyointestinalis TaxID=91352 RepID=A0A9W5ET47_CAMHY|nr:hypothetical protein [Campylobacter hyointestinalis]CUU79224.1 Uncharacterised protein [Campylobacter hyointestinalis subsp. hyointestinalis]CUU83256.1 Uncharacterised protein [Campylobacter hyointestinalis subsp. hyointestinalis]CUU88661.1 Uncharacterised protein [Campylobacter hyointestinalis subsp. hyointestinalis]
MRKIFLTKFLITVTAIVFSGCGASSMPSPETLKKSSIEDFLEGQGFEWNEEKEFYELQATKNRVLDKDGNWTNDFKELYKQRFTEYCHSKGGKIESIETLQNRVYPISKKSSKASTMIYSKLNANIKNWEKIEKLCTVNDLPFFGYSFSSTSLDVSRGGVDRYNVDAKAYQYNDLYRKAVKVGIYANEWWNIEAYAVPIKLQDFEEAKLFISSYLKHNHFEEDKKAQQPAIQTDKNYTTPSSGFRRF